MILASSSVDGGMTVGLWKLLSLDSHRPPWYQPLVWPYSASASKLKTSCDVWCACQSCLPTDTTSNSYVWPAQWLQKLEGKRKTKVCFLCRCPEMMRETGLAVWIWVARMMPFRWPRSTSTRFWRAEMTGLKGFQDSHTNSSLTEVILIKYQ